MEWASGRPVSLALRVLRQPWLALLPQAWLGPREQVSTRRAERQPAFRSCLWDQIARSQESKPERLRELRVSQPWA